MRPHRLVAVAVAVASTCLAPAHAADSEIADYLKADKRQQISRLDADVSGDGVPDVVLVSTPQEFKATVTVFLRLQGKSVDGKGRMAGLQAIDSLDVEVSPYGPPTVSVRNGVLLVESLVGGTTVRTTSKYRYRLDAEEGRMRLIGLDAERAAPGGVVRMSWNLLNGARITRRNDAPEVKSTVKADKTYMSATPQADELLDGLVRRKP
jgi:hypothetical protein